MIRYFLAVCVSLAVWQTCSAKTEWQAIEPGLAYVKLNPGGMNPWGQVHAFRIDPKRYRLHIAMAKDFEKKAAHAKQFVLKKRDLIIINGGFFTPRKEPLGLRIENGITRSRLKNISWWGVLYQRRHRYNIVAQRQFRNQKSIRFAIQSGPRLLINGTIPRLKGGVAERSAIGITKRGQLIIVVTDNAPMTTNSLAVLMKKSWQDDGLGCYQALNLDGGNSTQLYAKAKDFELNITGFSQVTDAVVIRRR